MRIIIEEYGRNIVARGYNRHGLYIGSVTFPKNTSAIEAARMVANLADCDEPDMSSAE